LTQDIVGVVFEQQSQKMWITLIIFLTSMGFSDRM